MRLPDVAATVDTLRPAAAPVGAATRFLRLLLLRRPAATVAPLLQLTEITLLAAARPRAGAAVAALVWQLLPLLLQHRLVADVAPERLVGPGEPLHDAALVAAAAGEPHAAAVAAAPPAAVAEVAAVAAAAATPPAAAAAAAHLTADQVKPPPPDGLLRSWRRETVAATVAVTAAAVAAAAAPPLLPLPAAPAA